MALDDRVSSTHIKARGEAFLKKIAAQREKQLANPSPVLNIPSVPVYSCPVCFGTGRVTKDVPVGHPDFGKSFPCPEPTCERGNELRVRAWENRLKTARIPAGYEKFTFETWQQLHPSQHGGKMLATIACWHFANNSEHYVSVDDCYAEMGEQPPADNDATKNSLMLFGPVGTGKTGLAIATLNAIVQRGKSVLYIRARDLIEEVQKRYAQGKRDHMEMSAEEALEEFKSAPVLFIDEFNISKASEDRRDIFETLMRYRYGNSLPTIMTANATQEEFLAMWGERTADVVFAMAHWIPVAGQKLRQTHRPLEAK